jgi:crotonobetaine/carnitine-CoA ligase
MLDNHLDYVVSWFALSCLGAVEVPVNTAYQGSLLGRVLNRCGARVAIVEARFLDVLASVDSPLDHLETIVVRGHFGEKAVRLGANLVSAEEMTSGSPIAAPCPTKPWDINALLLTSGTTGPSRLVSVPHGLTYSDCDPEWFPGATSEDVVFVSLPLFHVSGQGAVYNGVIAGATVVVADRFHSSTFWTEASRYGCTFAPILGVMPQFLMNRAQAPNDAANTLMRIRMAPVLATLDEFCDRFGVTVGSAYGMTEISNPICAPFGVARPGACGWLRGDFDAQIVDQDDRRLDLDQVGELVVRPLRPWSVSAGYYGDADATVTAWRNLWIHTGDALKCDSTGQYFFVDRLKDAIRRRGENISSFEVEQEVNSHPDVVECAVVGLDVGGGEQEVHVIVVPRGGSAFDPEALTLYLSRRLPAFMVPRFVTTADSLPRTPSGKVRKQSLRETGLGAGSWRGGDGAPYRVASDGPVVGDR